MSGLGQLNPNLNAGALQSVSILVNRMFGLGLSQALQKTRESEAFQSLLIGCLISDCSTDTGDVSYTKFQSLLIGCSVSDMSVDWTLQYIFYRFNPCYSDVRSRIIYVNKSTHVSERFNPCYSDVRSRTRRKIIQAESNLAFQSLLIGFSVLDFSFRFI